MVKRSSYAPEKGDIVWLNFAPQAGHEQMGRRPALVLSPLEYNSKTNLAIFCPITSKETGYPFEVQISRFKRSGRKYKTSYSIINGLFVAAISAINRREELF
ncbi:type II toxin-antitoxin system PemK/MazF family toxin [Leptospira ilyithenensis]|uniref:mRNA-degrading endonuclease n=1 Tax=Leptospira ilyithenensis TaxID=2484901 RepID=A0A4R9LJN0_9LEPT|nr:type II toxin-antitoxin system PemK/MazF family toxin [Leptospira ilyithenensis]TGN07097.1 mRNA-degrading endonuclease [Leptospira ilyithenensis]